MDLIHFIILGLIQGITEFLPISSSAHLILLPAITGWSDQGLVNDIAAHVGSLLAVLIYFQKDLKTMLNAWLKPVTDTECEFNRQLTLYILIASLPIMIAGLTLYEVVSDHFRSPFVIATASIIFGLALWWSDRAGMKHRAMTQMSYKDAIIIGCAQAIALIPGTSRSGITMTAALALGLDRHSAARFSFLLSIPAIIMAGGYEGIRHFMHTSATDWSAFFTVALVSAVSAWISIHYFLKYLQRTGMLPYVIYRLGLGVVLLLMFA